RIEDIPAIVQHFLDKYSKQLNKRVTGISNGAMRAMLTHPWRGNVRELENVIERAVIFAEGRQIEVSDLPFAAADADRVADTENLRETMAQFERQHIIAVLRRCQYDKAEAARRLDIGLSSLYRKLDELNIPKNLGEQANPEATKAS